MKKMGRNKTGKTTQRLSWKGERPQPPTLEKIGRQEELSQYGAKGGGVEGFILGGPHLSTRDC